MESIRRQPERDEIRGTPFALSFKVEVTWACLEAEEKESLKKEKLKVQAVMCECGRSGGFEGRLLELLKSKQGCILK